MCSLGLEEGGSGGGEPSLAGSSGTGSSDLVNAAGGAKLSRIWEDGLCEVAKVMLFGLGGRVTVFDLRTGWSGGVSASGVSAPADEGLGEAALRGREDGRGGGGSSAIAGVAGCDAVIGAGSTRLRGRGRGVASSSCGASAEGARAVGRADGFGRAGDSSWAGLRAGVGVTNTLVGRGLVSGGAAVSPFEAS